MEQLRPPARLAEDAVAPARAPRGRDPGARPAPLARPPAGRARDARPDRGRRGRSRTSTRSRAASRSRPAAPRPMRGSRPPRRSSTRCSRATGRSPTGSPPRTRRWTVPPDRVQAVVEALVPRYRDRAATLFGLPAREDLRVSLVRDQPWTGYNWYDGGYRSRVDFNLDLPVRLPALLGIVGARDVPRPPPRARAQGAGAGRGARPARGDRPADQHPRVPDLGGPGERRQAGSPSRPPSAPTCSSSWRRSPGLPLADDPGRLREAARPPGGDRRPRAGRSTRRGSTRR